MIYEEQVKKEMNDGKQHIFDGNQTDLDSTLQDSMVDMAHTISKVNEFKEDFRTEKISLAEAKVQKYMQVIENEKKRFLIYSQQQQHYSQCHTKTMLNSIDRRRRTLKERVQLMNDFSTMLADENDDDDDDSDVEEIYGNID